MPAKTGAACLPAFFRCSLLLLLLAAACPALPVKGTHTCSCLLWSAVPHDRKRLATVPVLQKCIDGVAVLRSRYYRPGHPDHCPLKEALEGAAAGRYPLLVLFPGAGAQDVREVAAQLHAAAGCSSSNGGSRDHSAVEEQAALVCGQQEQPGGQHLQQQQQQTGVQQPGMLQQSCSQPCSTKQDDQGGRQAPAVTCQLSTPPAGRQSGDPLYALLVIDGTWKEAKEMYKTVVPHALSPGGPGLRVQLPPPAPVLPAEQPAEQAQEHSAALQQQAQEQQQVAASEAGEQQPQEARAGEAAAAAAGVDQAPPVLLRMEPMPGCLTTCEAGVF